MPTQQQNTYELSTDIDTAIEQAREELNRIEEKAEFAIQVVTQAIRTQATVAKGKVLLALRGMFDERPELEGKWTDFVESLPVRMREAQKWMSAAQAVLDNGEAYGEDLLMGFTPIALSTLNNFPEVIKEAVLEDAAATGEPPTQKEVAEISKAPTTKLAAAMEKLEEVALKKNDESISSGLRSKAKADEAKLEETIEQLKSQIAEDKIKKEQADKEQERLQAELDLLKYDDAAAREQRVKRVGNSLIVSLPAVLSDLQKYVAEKDHYESKTTKSIDESIETLLNYLKPLYA